jgi:cellulose 1,4-beta-cellobiosidase
MDRRTRLPALAMALGLMLSAVGACNRPPGGPRPTTTRGSTSSAPTTPSTQPSTTGPSSTTSSMPGTTTTTRPGNAGPHVENPFAGAKPYVNPQWQARVRESASRNPSLAAQMGTVANQPTAVWMDRIAAIDPPTGMSLRDHLDAAASQGQGGQPVLFTVVIYDLPNRDCAALASNGELKIAENGLARYRSEYVDPIASILSDPRYANVRIAAIIEPDSLPNLVTNTSDGTTPANAKPACDEAKRSGAYVQGVQYALDKLHAISNVYTYVDMAHSGWLGWDNNLSQVVSFLTETIRGTRAGLASVDGFVTNTANYTPTTEPFLPNPDAQVGGQPVKSAAFYEWNPHFSETSYADALRSRFTGAGFPQTIGMLIDTSRNGWGGSARPTAASTATELNAFVNASRVDRRNHRGNWCNQRGAGIGERPRANPAPGFDAYVWIKPPGESDGSSKFIPNDEGKGFDQMCDPAYGGNSLNGNNPTQALPDSPIAGQWFEAQFVELVRNAHPAL